VKGSVTPEYLSLQQVANYLGIGKRTVREFIQQKTNPLPHFRIRKKILRVARSDLDKWMQNYRINNATEIDNIVDSLLKKIR
jgi:excisionase family DNA binding protein